MYCKLSIHAMIRQRKRERTGERDLMTIRYHIILGRAQGFLGKRAQRTDRTVARCHGAVFRVVVGSVPIALSDGLLPLLSSPPPLLPPLPPSRYKGNHLRIRISRLRIWIEWVV